MRIPVLLIAAAGLAGCAGSAPVGFVLDPAPVPATHDREPAMRTEIQGCPARPHRPKFEYARFSDGIVVLLHAVSARTEDCPTRSKRTTVYADLFWDSSAPARPRLRRG
jgi:hypothetical protein